ncbi:MAG: exonuclease domain-containing protein [Treponema sp.]|nr:exonuclease domain-containing protein [Treponema sp.]
MNDTYLFFDIECANCFNGEGKMCSFGYVVTDCSFTVIDSQDIVMNPQSEFDWYLFSPKNRCPLAYSKEYFRRQHTFEDWYKPIKELLTASYRKIIGFSSTNDVNFVITACKRYGLPLINFAAYDAEPMLNNANGERKGLEAWAEYYHIDTTELRAHRSCDDAMMTMLVVKALAQAQNTGIDLLLEKNRSTLLSVEKAEELMIERKRRNEILAKIEELYGKKDKLPHSNVLSGELYSIGFRVNRDIDEAYRIARLVYENGGMLCKRLKETGTLILADDEIRSEEHRNKGIKAISKSDFCSLVGK